MVAQNLQDLFPELSSFAELLPRSCKNAEGMERTLTNFFSCRLFNFLLAPQFGTTPVVNASNAFAIEVNSLDLVKERASHSFAVSSHFFCRTRMKLSSAFLSS